MNFKLSIGTAVTALFVSAAAYASPIYITPLPADGTQTPTFSQLDLDWTALSTYDDANNNGMVDVGETVVDTVVKDFVDGVVVVNNNYGDIGLIPSFGSAASGYGVSWSLYFDYRLEGEVTDIFGPSSILAEYTSGYIDIYYDDFSNQGINDAGRNIEADTKVMSIEVIGSGGDIANFLLFGVVSQAVDDTFFFADGVDFASLLGGGLVISTRVDTNLDTNEVPASVGDGFLARQSTLNGSASFDVPEPGVLALLGVGLIGLSVARRKSKAA